MEFSARQTRWMSIFSVAGGAIVILMLGVIPTLQTYFASVRMPLPLPTRIVIGMSAFVTAYWWACVAGLVAFLLAIKQLDKILPKMLAKVADLDDDEVDTAVEALLTKMEPLMIVGLLGVVVGGMIVATYLPIWDVVNAVK